MIEHIELHKGTRHREFATRYPLLRAAYLALFLVILTGNNEAVSLTVTDSQVTWRLWSGEASFLSTQPLNSRSRKLSFLYLNPAEAAQVWTSEL